MPNEPKKRAMNLSKQLRLYLDQSGMSIQHLSKQSSVATSTIHNWLSGAFPKDVTKLKKVSDVLGVSLDWLLFGDGIQIKETSIKDYEDELNIGLYEVVLRKIKK